MILPYSKFKEFCFYKDNTNYLDFILCQLSIKHSKNVFNSFVENKTFDNWFKLMESNVSSDSSFFDYQIYQKRFFVEGTVSSFPCKS